VRIPGERATRERAHRLSHGVPIEAQVRERLAARAGASGIEFPARLNERRPA
jgi:LDH2 family malate/lactate/ureidoglycolate dehydrogenase